MTQVYKQSNVNSKINSIHHSKLSAVDYLCHQSLNHYINENKTLS